MGRSLDGRALIEGKGASLADWTIVLVHYHAAEPLGRAVEALRREASGGRSVRLVVVDNGSSPRERRDLERLGVELLEPGRNLGYAGAANAGLRDARTPLLAIANPDARPVAGALAALERALDRFAIAGPAFTWDDAGAWRLPPAEARTRLGEWLDALAPGHPWAERWARGRWRRSAARHWRATQPLPSFLLSGAFLAFRGDAWERVGPFDEGYALYFEETDWLWRARRLGLTAAYVPEARMAHEVGTSTRREPRAQEWFELSAARFRRRAFGEGFARRLEATARRAARRSRPALRLAAEPFAVADAVRDAARAVELSPRPVGYPAASCRTGSGVAGEGAGVRFVAPVAPPPVEGIWRCAWIDGRGREITACHFEGSTVRFGDRSGLDGGARSGAAG